MSPVLRKPLLVLTALFAWSVILFPTSSPAEGINSEDNVDLPLGAGGATVITICAEGGKCGTGSAENVGIGTSEPKAKLEVNGTFRPGAATKGAICSPLGALAYSSTSGAPLYCSSNGQWTGISSGGVCGGSCGDASWNKIRGIGISIINKIPCKGQNILSAGAVATCPSGCKAQTHSCWGPDVNASTGCSVTCVDED